MILKPKQIQTTVNENLKTVTEAMAQQYIHKLGETQVGDIVQVPVIEPDNGL